MVLTVRRRSSRPRSRVGVLDVVVPVPGPPAVVVVLVVVVVFGCPEWKP